ncbi:MAG: 2',3'-cyclic-nucleotide 2'-phosphodiesterase [Myxococcota bacterium]|nr:2',3'-cyclic-nucleotide 2'-phosphodiesterase [Myxococcota bacterium]
MKVIFLGDVVGKPGRQAVKGTLGVLMKQYGADFAVVNGENMAGGTGITPETAADLFESGAHVITSGNHVWKKKEVNDLLQQDRRILRPANYPKGAPGDGWTLVENDRGQKLGVVNLQGRVFMEQIDCPFRKADEIVDNLRKQTRCILVDMHAETTSEKRAIGYYLDGRVSFVVGTHTHVQTADDEIFAHGTGFLTDAGMCGPTDSVIGVRKELVLQKFLTGRPVGFQVASEGVMVQGAFVEIDDANGKCLRIERIRRPPADMPNVSSKEK